MAGKKVVQRDAATGRLRDLNTVNSSADTPASGDVVAVNAGGVVDKTLLPATTASAGSGDVGKVPLLDSTGRLDPTTMPVGVTAEVVNVTASEALSAGDGVNLWNSTGLKARKADASTSGKPADGFVLAAVASSASATVYLEGVNTGATGLTPGGDVYLDPANPGKVTTTYPTFTAGQTSQIVGKATSATAYSFDPQPPITTA